MPPRYARQGRRRSVEPQSVEFGQHITDADSSTTLCLYSDFISLNPYFPVKLQELYHILVWPSEVNPVP